MAIDQQKLAIDDWSVVGIKATFGAGGVGILMLCITSLDRLNLDLWGALFIATSPGIIFALASLDFFPIKVVRAAQWFAIVLFAALSVMALFIARDNGMKPGDEIFIGFMFVGLVTCLVAALDLCGINIPNPTDRMFSHAAQRIIREFFMILGALSLVAGGILLLMTGGPDWLGWICIIFFGLGAIVFSIEFVRGIKRTVDINAAGSGDAQLGEAQSNSQSNWAVMLDEHKIRCIHQNEGIQEIQWNEIDHVAIRIEDEFLPVPYWYIGNQSRSIRIPNNANGGKELFFDGLSKYLEGYHCDETFKTIITASSAMEGSFVLWKRKPGAET